MDVELCPLMQFITRSYSGGTPKSTETSYYGGTIPWLTTTEINYSDVYDTEKHISESGFDNSSAKWVPVNSVIIAMYGRGTAGRCCVNKVPVTTNQACYSLIFDSEKMHYRYAYYAIKNSFNQLDSLTNGAVQQNLNSDIILNFKIPHHNLGDQLKIVSILGNIDDKIEQNRKVNDNLQEQINAIFTKSIESSNGKAIRFGSLVKIGSGGTPKTSVVDYWGGDIPFFSPKDVSGLYVSSTEKNITKLGLDNCNSGHYPRNTTFITARGTVGKIALAACDMAMNQSCYAIIATAAGHEYYVHQLSLYAVRSIKQKSNGAVFDAINATDITEEMVPDLSEDKIASFEKEVTPLYEMVWANDKEIRTLSGVRDYLLPKMMSGEIDVSTLEIPN